MGSPQPPRHAPVSLQSWREIKNVTFFFRNIFRLFRKCNEINALHASQNGLYDSVLPRASLYRNILSYARNRGRFFPLSKALAGVSSPSPNLSHLLKADVYSPSPFMEMGGGRKAGGEVQIEKKITSEKNFLTPPPTTRISRPRRRDETSPWHDENRKEESDREI